MLNFLCADAQTNQGGSPLLMIIIMVVLIVAMFVVPMISNKKKNQEYMNMINSIKVGDLVKTAGGIIGKVTKITDKGDIKTVILETGSKTEKSVMEFDLAMIYCVLKSTKADSKNEQYFENKDVKKVEEKTEEQPVNEEETAEEKAEEKTEEVKEEPKKEKKTSTKSKSTKKTSSKK